MKPTIYILFAIVIVSSANTTQNVFGQKPTLNKKIEFIQENGLKPHYTEDKRVLFETTEYKLLCKIKRVHYKRTRKKKYGVPHVSPIDYSYFLIEKKTKDIIQQWFYSSTGRGESALWIFEDGTLCTSLYSTIYFRSKSGQNNEVSQEFNMNTDAHGIAFTTLPDGFTPILANATGIFICATNEPHLVYSVPWKSVMKSNWNDSTLVSGKMGISEYYRGYLLCDEYFFGERNGNITVCNLNNFELESVDLNKYFPEHDHSNTSLVNYHDGELIVRRNNKDYVYNLFTKTFTALTTTDR